MRKLDYVPYYQEAHDNVNHPKHYTSHPSGIECIDITRHHNFCIGNVFKYLWRAGLKDGADELQDCKKALWYLNKHIESLEHEKNKNRCTASLHTPSAVAD